MQTLATDPSFVRVRKGVYAIRALMGNAPYEAIGRVPKKTPKGANALGEKAGEQTGGALPLTAAPAEASAGKEAGAETGCPVKKKARLAEGEGKDAAEAEEPYDPQLRTLEVFCSL